MKIKKDFVLRKLAGGYVATAVGSASAEFKGIIKLNETGAFIWRELENDTDAESIAQKLCDEYSIDKQTALNDVNSIVSQLKSAGVIDG